MDPVRGSTRCSIRSLYTGAQSRAPHHPRRPRRFTRQPEVAIISVGSNTHGHPAKRTLETLENNDVPLILQTGAGTPEEFHAFEDCGDDLDCTQTLQVIVHGSIHIGVTADVYFITALPPPSAPGVETLNLLLECDELGCEGVVE